MDAKTKQEKLGTEKWKRFFQIPNVKNISVKRKLIDNEMVTQHL